MLQKYKAETTQSGTTQNYGSFKYKYWYATSFGDSRHLYQFSRCHLFQKKISINNPATLSWSFILSLERNESSDGKQASLTIP